MVVFFKYKMNYFINALTTVEGRQEVYISSFVDIVFIYYRDRVHWCISRRSFRDGRWGVWQIGEYRNIVIFITNGDFHNTLANPNKQIVLTNDWLGDRDLGSFNLKKMLESSQSVSQSLLTILNCMCFVLFVSHLLFPVTLDCWAHLHCRPTFKIC